MRRNEITSVANRVVVCAALCAALSLSLAPLVACPKGAAARPLDRSAPPTHGVADARVLHVDGSVQITPPQGAPFAAKVGTDLVADDLIGAATSSKVVVVLRNGHAVRIDDAGALKVRDIVLFQAPPTDRPVDEQLQELMDEGENLPLTDVRDRAAAWRQMLRAAETGGTESRNEMMKSEPAASVAAVEAVALDDAAPRMEVEAKAKTSAADPARPDSAKPIEAPEADRQAPAEKALAQPMEDRGGGLGLQGVSVGGGGGGGGGSGTGIGSLGAGAGAKKEATQGEGRDEGKMGKKDAPRAPSAYALPTATPAGDVPSGFTARFGVSAAEAQPIELTPSLATMSRELGKCIGAALSNRVSLSSVQLLIEVRDGKVKRVRMTGALPVPLCARSVAVESAAVEVASTRGNSGWLVLTVPLSP